MWYCIFLYVTPIAIADSPLVFERTRIGEAIYEAVSAADVDRDGAVDIISGEYWYEGPDFTTRHRITTIQRIADYYDDFADYPLDVNGDEYPDIVTGGWWGKSIVWRENPKNKTDEWKTHVIDECGNVETIRFWDIDGDGHVEAVPNAGGRITAYQLVRDASGRATGEWKKHVLKPDGCGHGLGFGDLNGDGRGDFVIPTGWLEAPANPWKDQWTWHDGLHLGDLLSVPILVHDVNEDGKADLIAGNGHGYGLWWYEQATDADGKPTWTQHTIEADRAQFHDMLLYDIDNDNKPELVTGKRYRAHLGHDPGSSDPLGLYYYEIENGQFRRVTIDYGPPTRASGAGIYLWITDLDKNNWPDILAAGKEGLYLFKNQGRTEQTARAKRIP